MNQTYHNVNTAGHDDENQKPQQDQQQIKEVSVTKPMRVKRSRKSSTAFKTISEVADLLDVQQHVLRFWETKFTQVKPLKRGGGRRYYRPEDVELLQTIHQLLYTDGYTIKGVQKLLKGQGKHQIISGNLNGTDEVSNDTPAPAQKSEPKSQQNVPAGYQPSSNVSAANAENNLTPKQRAILQAMLGELKDLRDMLK